MALGSLSIAWPLVCTVSMSGAIIDITESPCVTIDGACLTEEADASEDGRKIASKKEWRRGEKCSDVGTNFFPGAFEDQTEPLLGPRQRDRDENCLSCKQKETRENARDGESERSPLRQ
ncbi:hypothetical protein TNCV_3649471 [Trichonephila clavipes]|nr:hypothetical protein TNCV_3649471 [Trichonephila clavipes]